MKIKLAFGLLICVLGLSANGHASELVHDLENCGSIDDPYQRLACFDSVLRRLADPSAHAGGAPADELGSAETPDQAPSDEGVTESASATRPDWAEAPSPAPGKEIESPRSFDAVVIRITRTTAGRHRFFTDDGAVWEQTQDVSVRLPDSLPASVEFRRRLTGNPTMSFEGVRAAYRVRRIE